MMNTNLRPRVRTVRAPKQPGRSTALRLTLGVLALLAATPILADAPAVDLPHVNWENHPVHALDASPDRSLLAVAHTADARVQFFDVREGVARPAGHVLVGLDPVSVRFRTDTELWVVNHISDSISIVDVPTRTIRRTLRTGDEPFDVVFAAGQAFVSCSQANEVWVFDAADPTTAEVIPIIGEDPRAMAVSADGREVYVAIFESGNGTTVLSGATAFGSTPPNALSRPEGPYGGLMPPPNDGDGFLPAIAPDLPFPPRTALIVRKDEDARWLDDNGGDWSDLVSGPNASLSGRVPGWDLADHDLAIIEAQTRAIRYAGGLLTIVPAIAPHPVTGEVLLVGTEASNEIRFEPNLNGVFSRVLLGRIDPNGLIGSERDLNPHLTYEVRRIDRAARRASLGDPRALVWSASGERAYVAGMGSNNVVVIDQRGTRIGEPIAVGEGPVGLALASGDALLYVWNHFEASLSVVDTGSGEEIQRVHAFNPLPPAIRQGRRHLYATHDTSGLGHLACATCHVDARTDRLAWDLGDPGGTMKPFEQNCASDILGPNCRDFHPMKGPMVTQTLQDMIGHEPLHWRGDRDGIEAFDQTYVKLQAADAMPSREALQELEAFLSTITLPPNPFRELDNSLSAGVDLAGHVTSDRFGPPGRPFGTGNAQRGLDRFRNGLLQPLFGSAANCASCHSLPTGLGVNGALRDPVTGVFSGGRTLPLGPNGENRLGVMSGSTNQGRTMKIPQLRTLYERTGFDLRSSQSTTGFGLLHDGTVPNLAEFLSLPEFVPESDQDVADLIAFLLSFSGSDLPLDNSSFSVDPPLSRDTHAAVGQQETIDGVPTARLERLLAIADSGRVDLVAMQSSAGVLIRWLRRDGAFRADDGAATLALADLTAAASPARPVTFTTVPAGLGERFAFDRDGDGITDAREIEQGSDPADAASRELQPVQGLWLNPARSGHGVDVQTAGSTLAATWYTYGDDGSPTWYQAVGPRIGADWIAEMRAFTWDGGQARGEIVGTMSFAFADGRTAEFCWTLGERSGCEPFERFAFAEDQARRQQTGLWFDPAEPGYGLTVDSQGNVQVVVVYFYDLDGRPRWVLGAGDNRRVSDITLQSFQGFCPDCAFVPTTPAPGGTIRLHFALGERQAATILDAQIDGSAWTREADLRPLTDLPVDYGR